MFLNEAPPLVPHSSLSVRKAYRSQRDNLIPIDQPGTVRSVLASAGWSGDALDTVSEAHHPTWMQDTAHGLRHNLCLVVGAVLEQAPHHQTVLAAVAALTIVEAAGYPEHDEIQIAGGPAARTELVGLLVQETELIQRPMLDTLLGFVHEEAVSALAVDIDDDHPVSGALVPVLDTSTDPPHAVLSFQLYDAETEAFSVVVPDIVSAAGDVLPPAWLRGYVFRLVLAVGTPDLVDYCSDVRTVLDGMAAVVAQLRDQLDAPAVLSELLETFDGMAAEDTYTADKGADPLVVWED